MHYHWLVFTLLSNVAPAPAPPPPTYISDRLSIPMRGANALDAPVVKHIIGGAPIKLLSREGDLLKIRTEDGSIGWVERELVTNDKPAHMLYLEVSDQLAKAQETIKSLQDKPAAAPTAIPTPTAVPINRDEKKIVSDLRAEIKNTLEHVTELEKHIRDNRAQAYTIAGHVRELEAENSALKRLATKTTAAASPREAGNASSVGTAPGVAKFVVSLPWFLAGLSLMLVLGGVLGGLVMRRRSRRAQDEYQVES